MTEPTALTDSIIYAEMLSHPVIFSHLNPKKIILTHSDTNILNEILKHESIIEIYLPDSSSSDTRVKTSAQNKDEWKNTHLGTVDIIIATQALDEAELKFYFDVLHPAGILLQLSQSPFYLAPLKILQNQFYQTGFEDVMTLSFPQPHFPTGTRCALMAKKTGILKKIREKDIYNKNFKTQFYNFDVHKAALVQPEFMREELTPQGETA